MLQSIYRVKIRKDPGKVMELRRKLPVGGWQYTEVLVRDIFVQVLPIPMCFHSLAESIAVS